MPVPPSLHNKKRYVSIKEATHLVAYTRSYITSLARTEKINAKQVDGAWEVDIDSLKKFELEAIAQKERRQEALRKERLQEQRLREAEEQGMRQIDMAVPKARFALVQAFVVFAVMLVVGSAGAMGIGHRDAMLDVYRIALRTAANMSTNPALVLESLNGGLCKYLDNVTLDQLGFCPDNLFEYVSNEKQTSPTVEVAQTTHTPQAVTNIAYVTERQFVNHLQSVTGVFGALNPVLSALTRNITTLDDVRQEMSEMQRDIDRFGRRDSRQDDKNREELRDSMEDVTEDATMTGTFTVAGDAHFEGALYDNNDSAGTSGYVLQSTGTGFQWVATSSLGITTTGGGGGGAVNSVNGQTGTVLLDTGDIGENGNQYFTDARARSAISETITGIEYTTGVFSLTSGYQIPLSASTTEWSTAYSWGNHALANYLDLDTDDTDDLTEGTTNLFFTDERTDDRVNTLIIGGTNVATVYDDAANTLTINASSTGGGGGLTEEEVEDFVGTMFVGTETGITVTYDDAGNAVNFVVDSITADMLAAADFGDFTCDGTDCSLDYTAVTLADFTNDAGFIDRSDLSSTATGLTYTNSTGVFSLTSGYTIPLSASTTEWSTAFSWGDHSTAGYLTGITGESLEDLADVDTFTQAAGNVLYWTGTGWNVTATSSWDTDTNTTYTAGTGLDLTGTQFSIESTVLTEGDIDTEAEFESALFSVITPGENNDDSDDLSDNTTTDLAEGTNQYFTNTRAQNALSETITGIDYATGVFSLTSGYTIPLSASTTEWSTAYGWGDHALANYLDLDTGDTDDLTEGSTNLFSQWNTAGSNINYTAGNVSVGTTTAPYKVTIQGTIGTVSEGDIFSQYDGSTGNSYPVIARYWDTSGTAFDGGTYIFGNGTNAYVGIEKPGGSSVNLFQVRASTSTFSGVGSFAGLATFSSGVNVNGETFTDFTGSGLSNVGGVLTVSTSSLTNLDADTLDGQDSTYYLNRANHTGTQTASTISDFSSTARNLLSSTATGLTYTNSTGVFSLTSGYTIPLSASTTEWSTAYGWGNHSTAGYLLATNNLSDLTASSTARTNLGLGTIATQDATNVSITGGSAVFTNATTTNLAITGDFILDLIDGCVEVAGGALTSTGSNCGTGSGGITSINGITSSAQDFVAATSSGLTLDITSAGGDHTFTLGLMGGYVIPLSASTTEWSTAFSWGDHSTAGYLTDITGESLEDLSDVAAMTQAAGDLLSWNGSAWTNIATSSLGFGALFDQDLNTTDTVSFAGFSVTGTATSTFAGSLLISGDIMPSADNTYSLGSPTQMWKDVYIGPGSLYINGQKVIEEDAGNDIIVSADTDQGLELQTEGTGNISFSPTGSGQILLQGNVNMSAGKTFGSTDNNPLDFPDGISPGNMTVDGNAITATNLNGGISLTPNGMGGVYVTSGNLGVGTTSPSTRLHVAGGARIDGALYDNTNSAGTSGYILQSSGTGFSWVATSSLGFVDSTLTEDEVEAIIFDADNTGTLSSGTLALDALSYSGTLDDTYINDNISIGSGGSVDDGALSSNVSLLGQSIDIGDETNLTISATGLELSGDTIALTSGYSIPLSASTTEWSTAFSWGNHALANYLDLDADDTDDLTEGSTNLFSQWSESGSDIYFNGGDVGIGTSTIAHTLSIDGTVGINTTNAAYDFSIHTGVDGNYGIRYHNGRTQMLSYNDADSGYADFDFDADTLGLNRSSGGPVEFGAGEITLSGLAGGILRTNGSGVISTSTIDISDDTNLTGDTEIVLTGDTLSLASTITRDTEIDTETELETILTDVTDVFTNTDGALDDDDLSDNTTTDLAEGTNQYFTTTRAQDALSETITGIDYAAGVFSLTSGYTIPLSASTTEWSTAYSWGDHSTAGYLTDITGESLEDLSDVDTFTQAAGNVLYWTGTGWNVTATSTWDTNTTYTAGDHLTLTGTEFDVDDDFVLNTGDSISGNLTFSGSAANIALGSNYLSGDGGDEGIFVGSTGNVGIGTATSLSQKLTVDSGASGYGLAVRGSESPGIQLYNSTSTANRTWGIYNSNTGNFTIRDITSAAGRFSIDTDGNVGIGTASPISTLELVAANPQLTFSDTDNDLMASINADGGDLTYNTATVNRNHIFQAGGSTLMTILGTDNVGIGDTTPASMFTVGANDAFQVTSAGIVASGTWNGTDIDVSDYTNLTESVAGLEFSGDALALTSGYTIPLSASTTEWSTAYGWGDHTDAGYLVATDVDTESELETILTDVTNVFTNTDGALDDDDLSDNTTTDLAEGTNQYFTNTRAQNAISETIAGIDYTTGVFSLTSGYQIPLSASTTEWSTAYGWGNHALANYLDLDTDDTDDLTEGTTNLFSQWAAATGGINYADGNVGIGTSTPTGKLSIAGGNVIHTASGDPTLKGTYNTSGTAKDIYVSGAYAYVADSAAGLQIIDISNPSSPTLAGTYNTSGQANGVYVSGTYAYVADGVSGLQIIDISNPSSPKLTGTYSVGASAVYKVYVAGSYAYVSSMSALLAIDISDPAAPTLADGYGFGTNDGIYVSGKYAYLPAGGSGLDIVDISDPTALTDAGGFSLGVADLVHGVHVSGKYAYGAEGTAGLWVADVSDPSTAAIVGSYNTDGTAYDVFVSGKYAYVADGTSGLQIIDINGAEFPTLLAGNLRAGTLDITDNIVAGNNLYGSGLNVGINGISSRGTLGVYTASSTAANPISAIFMGGNVGIGTTTPLQKLTVAGNAYVTDSLDVTGTTTVDIFTATGAITFSDLGGGVLVTDASGNLSTSTVSVSTLTAGDFGDFTCNGTTCSLDADTVSDNEIDFANVTLSDFTDDVGFLTDITSQSFFDLVDTPVTNTANRILYMDGSEVTSDADLTFNGAQLTLGGTGLSLSGTTANITLGSNYLSGDGGDEGIFVDSAGDVGIGTNSPGQKLTVNGRIESQGGMLFNQGSSPTDNLIYVGGTTPGDVDASFGFFVGGVGSAAGYDGPYMIARGNSFDEIASQRGVINFYAGSPDTPTGTEGSINFASGSDQIRMTVSRDGNVGIGDTTPSALLTVGSGDLFQVNSSGAVVAGTWNGTDIDISDYTTLAVASGYLALSDDTLSLAYTNTLAGNPALAASTCTFATTGLICEGSTADTNETLLTFTNPTADRTITFQNITGTVYVTGGTDVSVADGGTGRSSHTAYGLLAGGTTTTGAQQSITNGASGTFLKSAGTSALPTWASITEADISDLGTYLANGDHWTLSGTDLYYDGGNVGIGTTTPGRKLHVYGSEQVAALFQSTSVDGVRLRMIDGNQTNEAIGGEIAVFDQDMTFSTAAIERLRIDSSGNLGIGTTTPTTKLVVDGYQTITDSNRLVFDEYTSTTNHGPWMAYNSTADTFDIVSGFNSANGIGTNGIRFGVTGGSTWSTKMVIDGNGNVGIGTTTPDYNLHIANIEDSALFLEADTDNGGSEAHNAFVKFSQDAGAVDAILGLVGGAGNDPEGVAYTDALDNATLLGASYSAGSLQFGTNNAVRMTIEPDGNVGIGTSNPNTALQLDFGSTDTTATLGTSPIISIRNSTGGAVVENKILGSLMFMRENSTPLSQINAHYATTGNGADSDLRFFTSSAEQMRIDKVGNVGVGTSTPTARLSVQATGTSDILNLFETGGTEVLTVLESGNVGIGSTTPSRTLTVVGDAEITGSLYDSSGSAGTAGMVLQSTGTGFEWVATSTLGIGGEDTTVQLSSVQTLTSGTNATYTTPADVAYIVVEVWGGGGGGGLSDGGGGGGGYSMESIQSPSASYVYTIGGGGSPNNNGGTTCFGTNATACTTPILSATGGSGSTGEPGGVGGVGSGGDINLTGSPGGSDNQGGDGGDAPRGGAGGGGNDAGGNDTGADGSLFGGGGGGGQGAGQDGGSGAAGGIIVYEYTTVASGADLAENYPISDPSIEAGDIVAFDSGAPITVTKAENNIMQPLAGVVSTDPGIVLGDTHSVGMRPVALAGRVPVKFSDENGDVEIGDRITLSSIPGVGMKANPYDDSVGIVIDEVTDSNTVMVFLDLRPGIDLNSIAVGLLSPIYTSPLTSVGTENATFDFVGGMMNAFTTRLGAWSGFKLPQATTTASTTSTTTASSTFATTTPSTTTATSSLEDASVSGFMEVFFERIQEWFGSAANGIATLIVGEIRTEKLCFTDENGEESCLTKEAFDAMGTTTSDQLLLNVLASSSVATTSSSTIPLTVENVYERLVEITTNFVDGVLKIVGIVTETLTVGSSEKPSGVTLFDEQTGEPYCLKISGGEVVHTAGECTAATSTESVLDEEPQEVPEVDEPEVIGTTTDNGTETGTSTDDGTNTGTTTDDGTGTATSTGSGMGNQVPATSTPSSSSTGGGQADGEQGTGGTQTQAPPTQPEPEPEPPAPEPEPPTPDPEPADDPAPPPPASTPTP